MNAQMTILRRLILKDLDPAYYKWDKNGVNHWLNELPLIEERMFSAMQDEVLGVMDNVLVDRHLKQVRYDCIYLMDTLYKYVRPDDSSITLYEAAGKCLDGILTHIECRYAGLFSAGKQLQTGDVSHDHHERIRVLFSVDVLAYFFKLLNKAGVLDGKPFTQLIVAISKNFITPGVGKDYISPNSLTTKYRQVVQTTAKTVRQLLVKMLRHLDEEFTLT